MTCIAYSSQFSLATLVDDRLSPERWLTLADLLREVGVREGLGGSEVNERLYEVGSAAGLEALKHYLATLPGPAPIDRLG